MTMDEPSRDEVSWQAPAGTLVLVAEDDIVSSTLLTYLLRATGCEVEMVLSGNEAVARAAKRAFAVAFFDLLLPGMTGLEAAHRIRAAHDQHGDSPVLRIVAMSTMPLSEVWKSCSAAGMDAFLAKPIQKDDVIRVLQHVLSGEGADPDALAGIEDAVDLRSLLERLGGDTAFVRELAGGFVGRCPSMLVDIRDALWRADREQLALTAHRLSGSAAEFGASRVLAITHELERLGRKGDMRRASKLLPTLEAAAAEMQAALKRVHDTGRM